MSEQSEYLFAFPDPENIRMVSYDFKIPICIKNAAPKTERQQTMLLRAAGTICFT